MDMGESEFIVEGVFPAHQQIAALLNGEFRTVSLREVPLLHAGFETVKKCFKIVSLHDQILLQRYLQYLVMNLHKEDMRSSLDLKHSCDQGAPRTLTDRACLSK